MTYLLKILLPVYCVLLFTSCRQVFGDKGESVSIVEPSIEEETIIITSPQHGSIWQKGDVIKIQWLASGIEKVNIQLFRKTNFKLTIISNIENTGSYNWTIPNNTPLSNHYLIKISNQKDSQVYKYSGRFGIQ